MHWCYRQRDDISIAHQHPVTASVAKLPARSMAVLRPRSSTSTPDHALPLSNNAMDMTRHLSINTTTSGIKFESSTSLPSGLPLLLLLVGT